MTRFGDRPLFIITAILFVGGLLILFSSSVVLSQKNFGTIHYYTLRQLLYGGFTGIIGFLVTQMIPYRVWRTLALPLMVFSFIFLALLFVPELGYTAGGARRWLTFGPISFQPSEILKFSFIVYLASWLDARRRETASIAQGMIPFALMLAIVGMFLVMQPDIGTLGIVVASALLLYFLGGGKMSQIAILCLLGGVLFYFLAQLAPYRWNRILVFLNPSLDPRGIGYQIGQAFIAIGSGGFFGKGFGQSLQKYNYLPEATSDSIFAVFAEEMGFFGVCILIAVFCFFLWRGLVIAKRAPDVFGKLLAAGITLGITAQAFINMAAISGLLPLTGIPLPFVSHGNTSLAVTLTSIGVLMNISKNS